jgi:hypothetical protein
VLIKSKLEMTEEIVASLAVCEGGGREGHEGESEPWYHYLQL